MVSNTKLFPEQKQYVKVFQAKNPDAMFYNNGKSTVMIRREFKNSRMYAISFSTMSPNEIKFRKNVGKYYAISNFENGHYVLMPTNNIYEFIAHFNFTAV